MVVFSDYPIKAVKILGNKTQLIICLLEEFKKWAKAQLQPKINNFSSRITAMSSITITGLETDLRTDRA